MVSRNQTISQQTILPVSLLTNVPLGNYLERHVYSPFSGVPFAKVYKMFYCSATLKGVAGPPSLKSAIYSFECT